MWGDGGQCTTSHQEVDEIGEGSKDPFCLVRGGTTHCLLKVAWARPEGPGAELLGKDLTPLLTAVSLRLSGVGTGPGGGWEGQLGCACSASPPGPQQREWPNH